LIFYYQSSHSLTSRLFKNEFWVKFQAPQIDYFEFSKNPNYSSITYYDNFSITYSEEIPDLTILQENFSELKFKYNNSRNLFELDLTKINDLIPLTGECFVEKFLKKKSNFNLSLILSQINLSLQLYDIINLRIFFKNFKFFLIFFLVQNINKTVKTRYAIKYISQHEGVNGNGNEMLLNNIEVEDETNNTLSSFYFYKYKTSSIKLFIESEIYQDSNLQDENQLEFHIILFSYNEILSLQSCLIEFLGNVFNLKENLEFNKFQNAKLVTEKKKFNLNFLKAEHFMD